MKCIYTRMQKNHKVADASALIEQMWITVYDVSMKLQYHRHFFSNDVNMFRV